MPPRFLYPAHTSFYKKVLTFCQYLDFLLYLCRQMETTIEQTTQSSPKVVKRTVLDYDDICRMAPWFNDKPRLTKWLMRLLALDKVNWIHDRHFDTPGIPFTEGLLNDLHVVREVRGEEILASMPPGGFITVSNHPFGAMDGIMLINLVGRYRTDYKVMVNMILNHITAMRPNFINVDALSSNDPSKQAVSRRGIAEAIKQVKDGHVLGFFPAGAVSKLTWGLRIEDREWQPNVMRIIKKLAVPVVPIYFHGHNSTMFTILGMIDWRLRTLKLPSEVFRTHDCTRRISVGQPVTVEEQAQYDTPEALGQFLKQRTYDLKKW